MCLDSAGASVICCDVRALGVGIPTMQIPYRYNVLSDYQFI